ncbi:hypothetical protein MA16_Dca015707 [Dendrobium catenatum]|uniref:Uncharacterized protein n=1 Tax=Dendrobium catenatum TaxID=906689 RepID=A0A2I0V8I4_9ASPA|nr:hypothetical protein MA16_Dca015707 [Dendrobium catenatum]
MHEYPHKTGGLKDAQCWSPDVPRESKRCIRHGKNVEEYRRLWFRTCESMSWSHISNCSVEDICE